MITVDITILKGVRNKARQGANCDFSFDKFISPKSQVLDTDNPPSQCVIKPGEDKARGGAFSVGNGPIISFACIPSLGYYWQVKYQPNYRYWNFQWIETVLYLSLAGLAVGATYWLVLKRDA